MGTRVIVRETPMGEIERLVRPKPDEIARRAYLRHQNRGGGDGHNLDDWLEAERELSMEEAREVQDEDGA